MTTQDIELRLRGLIDEALAASERDPLEESLGANEFLPDLLDSVTLATLIVLIEEEWDFVIEDEEVEPELFESVGSLAAFVEARTTS